MSGEEGAHDSLCGHSRTPSSLKQLFDPCCPLWTISVPCCSLILTCKSGGLRDRSSLALKQYQKLWMSTWALFAGTDMAKIGRSGVWHISINLRPEMREVCGRLVNIHVYSDPWGKSFLLGTGNSNRSVSEGQHWLNGGERGESK